MPIDFGEIASSQRMNAARYKALAQAARDRGSLREAEYLTAQAAHYAESAQEQKMAQRVGLSFARKTLRSQPPEWQEEPFVASRVLPILRGAGHVAAAICQRILKRSGHALSPRS
jgi:hypothetical protein